MSHWESCGAIVAWGDPLVGDLVIFVYTHNHMGGRFEKGSKIILECRAMVGLRAGV